MRPRTIDCFSATINVRYELVNLVDSVALKVHFLIATPLEFSVTGSKFSRHAVKFNGGYKLEYRLNGETEIREFLSRMPKKLTFGTVVTPSFKNGPLSVQEFLAAVDTGYTTYLSSIRKKNQMKQFTEEVSLHGFAF
jgi:hypothetical protein